MTPHEFITRWHNTPRKERSAAQAHFIDLCRMLDEPTPAEADPDGADYDFEYGATKTTGGRGFADVFKRGHFGWEYKGTHGNLDAAFAQLQRYAVALDNPPLLIVSDIGTTIRIHTNWTNSVSHTYVIPIAELKDAEKRGWLKAALSDPDVLRPKKTRQQLTEEVAGDFAELARSLRQRGHAADEVAHFVNKLVFCMFAEDVKLLPDTMFTRMLDRAIEDPGEFENFAHDLFAAMRKGGRVGFEKVAWFNGGLFNDDRVFLLTKDEIKIVRRAAGQYWGDIDPSILGTLFERGLDPEKRSQLGAHYTDREKIMMIVRPVVVEPLAAEWETAKAEIAALMEKARRLEEDAKTKGGRSASNALGQATTARREAQAVLDRHLKRLADFRVLDPACGSGNFLYIALRELKDLELRAQVEAETLGLPPRFPSIGPEVVRGIELNSYAAELARVSVWIGEIQWSLRNGFPAPSNPILKPLETIEYRDALVDTMGPPTRDGSLWPIEAAWPRANAIIGNPPFLGGGEQRSELGDAYVETLRRLYRGKVPGRADLVVYWVAKAVEKLIGGCIESFGFVTTKSIAKGVSRAPLDVLTSCGQAPIVTAWTNEPWTVEGAAVRVSIVCAASGASYKRTGRPRLLNGMPVEVINPDLTTGIDVTKAKKLSSNLNIAFQGVKLTGPFDVLGSEARDFLNAPLNPNGLSNAVVVRRLHDIDDVVGRDSDRWVVDYGTSMNEADAALFELPFRVVTQRVTPFRNDPEKCRSNELRLRTRFWEFQRPRPELRRAKQDFDRVIVTPESSEHRVFVFSASTVIPQGSLFSIVRDDFTSFGVLSSRFHEVWSTAQGNRLGVGNQRRYNIGVTFETFPFPTGLTPDIPASVYADDPRAIAIATAAARLYELREGWLNPPDLVRREAEVVAGYPDRIVPVSPEAAKALRKRTLTYLYNEHRDWLHHAHRALDVAVAEAYGWSADMPDDEVLAHLFALNQERTAGQPAVRPVSDEEELEAVG